MHTTKYIAYGFVKLIHTPNENIVIAYTLGAANKDTIPLRYIYGVPNMSPFNIHNKNIVNNNINVTTTFVREEREEAANLGVITENTQTDIYDNLDISLASLSSCGDYIVIPDTFFTPKANINHVIFGDKIIFTAIIGYKVPCSSRRNFIEIVAGIIMLGIVLLSVGLVLIVLGIMINFYERSKNEIVE
jgi:hypothetical protein